MDDRSNFRGHVNVGLMLSLVLLLAAFSIFRAYKSWENGYNDLISLREDVTLETTNVENMLQRRLELIPDLVKTVEACAEHNEKIFDKIESASEKLYACLNEGNISEINKANEELTTEINLLVELAEKYPELVSGEQFTKLQDQIEGSVNRIAIAREDYNIAVSKYNKTLKKFPTVIWASLMGFTPIEEFKADEAAHETNVVDFKG